MLIRAAALLALLASPAAAQTTCGPTPVLMTVLMAQYGEAVVDELDLPSSIDPTVIITWQVWANATTGTWTLTGRNVAMMCVRAAGQNYEGQGVRDLLKIDQPT